MPDFLRGHLVLPRWLKFLGIALVAGALFAAYGLSTAMRTPRIVTYVVDDPRWPAQGPPLRILLLSDTHAGGPDMPVARLSRIVAQANALRPDLIVLSGDYVSHKLLRTTVVSPEAATAPFGRLRSRLGTFAVLGNHDHWHDSREMVAALQRAGVRVLSNRHVVTGGVTVAGVDDLHTGHADLPGALDGVRPGLPIVLVSHNPDIFPDVDHRPIVTLAGHTHGGQISLPLIGPLATASRFGRRYVHGHIVENGRHLIVSAGLGTSILPLRIGALPEIVVVELR